MEFRALRYYIKAKNRALRVALGKDSANQVTKPIDPSFWDGAYAGILLIGAVDAMGTFKNYN